MGLNPARSSPLIPPKQSHSASLPLLPHSPLASPSRSPPPSLRPSLQSPSSSCTVPLSQVQALSQPDLLSAISRPQGSTL
ncbi:hypothetical protein PM082_001798 [Marasmius tenuissimus]|nr:hypothetical protein PM082_001798 [Marasmius tenuissimus]